MRYYVFFFSSRRRHTRFDCDWSSDVCSSDLRSALGLSVFRVYCFLADPKRTVPESLLMRRISLFLATSTPSKCASPTNKLLTIVAEVVQSGFTVTVPVNASDRIVPFALRVS